MGMLLSMAILLALGSAFLEFKLVKSLPFLDRLNRKSMFFGLMFSILLSAGLGTVFGAAGLVVMMGGVISSALTEPIWAARRWAESKNVDTQAKVAKLREAKTDFVETYRPVGKAMKWTAVGVTSPVWLPVLIHRKNKQRKAAA